MSLKLGSIENISPSLTISYLGFTATTQVGLELSRWFQIAMKISYFKFTEMENIQLECFLFVNGIWYVTYFNYEAHAAIPPTFSDTTDQVFIGGGGENSFIGVVGKFEIFNPGALIQDGKKL